MPLGEKYCVGERIAPKKQALSHKVSNKQHLKGIRDGGDVGLRNQGLEKAQTHYGFKFLIRGMRPVQDFSWESISSYQGRQETQPTVLIVPGGRTAAQERERQTWFKETETPKGRNNKRKPRYLAIQNELQN